MVLFGEAGIGKTQLAGALVAAQTEPVVVVVRATPTMRHVPLGAFSLFLTAMDETDEPVAPASSAPFTTVLQIAESDPMLDRPANRANHSMSLGRLALLRGRPRTAPRLAREAVWGFDRADEQGGRPMAVGLFVEAHAALGDHDAILALADELGAAEDTTSDPIFRIGAARSRCWQHVAAGDVTRSITALVELGDAAVAQGVAALGALGLHDAVRLGAG